MKRSTYYSFVSGMLVVTAVASLTIAATSGLSAKGVSFGALGCGGVLIAIGYALASAHAEINEGGRS